MASVALTPRGHLLFTAADDTFPALGALLRRLESAFDRNLAENRRDDDAPSAFLATYTTHSAGAARPDHQPERLFTLRKVDQQDLIAKAGSDLSKKRNAPVGAKVLASDDLSEMFGIEMAQAVRRRGGPQPAPSRGSHRSRSRLPRRPGRWGRLHRRRRRRRRPRAEVWTTATHTREASSDIGAHAKVLGRTESPDQEAEGFQTALTGLFEP